MTNFAKNSLPHELVQVAAVAVAWLEMLGTDFLGAIEEIRLERLHQDLKWGPPNSNNHPLWMTILTEEVGEVAQAVLELSG